VSTTAKIRVLVVDDSVVVRRMLTSMLSNDPALEVVGSAPNGKIALARIPQYNPDAVVLDVEMPEMDGLQTLAELRKTHRMLPVIMFSTVTERGAAATLDALTLGANDYVTKPSTRDGAAGQIAKVIDDLINKIKAHCGSRVGQFVAPAPAARSGAVRSPVQAPAAAPVLPVSAVEPTQPAEVVAIGISTGGPNALAALIPTLPSNLGVPLLIVQHMPRLFTRLLAERLSEKAKILIAEAKHGDVLEPGRGWIAPGDYHMMIKRIGTSVVI
jgi:two-component system, chemotaxis family, protein-glutamate methylesterase/glutaminase